MSTIPDIVDGLLRLLLPVLLSGALGSRVHGESACVAPDGVQTKCGRSNLTALGRLTPGYHAFGESGDE